MRSPAGFGPEPQGPERGRGGGGGDGPAGEDDPYPFVPPLLDTCGTGGDRLTPSISARRGPGHGRRGRAGGQAWQSRGQSRSGSADVLAVLGVNVEAEVACVERCLDELEICFCFAPLLHNAMKHVAQVRKKLAVPTIFNILGPLINPARASRQLLGVGRAELRPLLAEALILLGTERSVVVHGSDGLDEVTLRDPRKLPKPLARPGIFAGPRPISGGEHRIEEHPGHGGRRECRNHSRGAGWPTGSGPRHRRGQRGRRVMDNGRGPVACRAASCGGRGHRHRRRQQSAGPSGRTSHGG